ncbi:DUF3429 domain-containing protein [Pseudodonghicola flavimaris]|uniref:DUF3429 domain-containing protein n=1 Tax=Pseudodonghicola flavimaris TaxID=3050036 RepID=A0ABT7F6J8_9RHOB|nr:DUF3429 domain-containing protein [Pseudodonghicola flavimaris]MDK3020238.1 DUF3429 domain-containing protein [Pseudodonghicola flavimaris]
MFAGVPRFARLIGLAALIPFAWGVATQFSADLSAWGSARLGPRFVAPYVQLFFGSVMLCFLSGALWGFATRASGALAAAAYVLAAVPPIWAYVVTGGGPTSAAMNLIFGFAGLALLDLAFAYWRLAPGWWPRLRLPMATVIIACLAVGVYL